MSTSTHSYVAVVDDDESGGSALGRLLLAVGFQPVIYHSAEAFLADEKKPRFDCLLLDIQLGGISGMELSRILVSSGSTAPIIFITAHDDPVERERALLIPCAAYLRKCEPAETLLAVIRKAIQSAGPSSASGA